MLGQGGKSQRCRGRGMAVLSRVRARGGGHFAVCRRSRVNRMILRLTGLSDGEKGERKGKSALGLFSPGRLGSPPPELPNHEMDIRFRLTLCKHHFGNN